MSTLPNKASELIRLALKDLKKVEASTDYSVAMSTWHQPKSFYLNDTCSVCLAGAVMAMTLEVPKDIQVEFESEAFTDTGIEARFDLKGFEISFEDQNKLYALNEFRTGSVSMAMQALLTRTEWLANKELFFDMNRTIPHHDDAPETFYSEMKNLAEELGKLGY